MKKDKSIEQEYWEFTKLKEYSGYVEVGWSEIRAYEMEAYIAGRSQNLAREKRIMALLEYYFRKSTWVEGEENRERNWEQFKKDSNL